MDKFEVNLMVPKQYIWKPKEDITTYELALIMPIFANKNFLGIDAFYEALPENAKRHFEVVG